MPGEEEALKPCCFLFITDGLPSLEACIAAVSTAAASAVVGVLLQLPYEHAFLAGMRKPGGCDACDRADPRDEA